MINEPSSPNVFHNVYLTSPKHSPSHDQHLPENAFYFNKKLESITQFIDYLDCNPENHAELTELELKWERSFFKNQLKASLFLNYTLIKLHCQATDELKQLKADLENRSEKKKIVHQFEQKLQWNTQPSKTDQESPSRSTSSNKKTVREAFEAEKKIIQAKHQKECDQLKKTIQHKQYLLRASKEENQYIRSKLIKISERNCALLKDNQQAEDHKQKLESDNKQIKSKLEHIQHRKVSQQMKLNQLNCSPIIHQIDTSPLEDGEISFNHQFFNQNMIQNKLLKKQIQEIQFQLEEMKQLNLKLKDQKNAENDTHKEVLQESCRLFLVELENQYIQIKKLLQESILEIGRCKSIIHQIQANTASNSKMQAENHNQLVMCKQSTNYLRVPCENCKILQRNYENIKAQNHQIQSKYHTLREKFDKTLNLELVQRQQWDAFLKDLKCPSPE